MQPGLDGPPQGYSFLLPPVEPDEIGRLGTYRVLRLLGQGGMGLVFLAEDVALRRRVALKVMRPGLDEDGAWQRFLREARLMASLQHEHLATVFQVGQENGVIFLAMELLRGETLEDWLARAGRPDVTEILRLGREIAAGLAAIHRAGLIHRDVKPANLWLEEPHGRVKILDFGLARPLGEHTQLTRAGMIVGTPAFMSPEQARGAALDVRSDLFSLGGVLYCLCTGRRPFPSGNTLGLLTALAVDDPRPPHELNPALPRALSALVLRLLAKKPAERPASAEEVLEALRRIESGATNRVEASAPPVESASARTAPLKPRNERPSRRRALAAVTVALLFGGSAVAGLTLFPELLARPAAEPPPAAAGENAAGKTYLSELQPLDAAGWISQPPAPKGPAFGKKPPPFRGVVVGGKVSPHGIFMHPPQGEFVATALSYRVGKRYGTFRGEVSLNDGPPQAYTPLTFSVRGDGKLLWQSKPLRSQSEAQAFAVPVAGVDVLRIEVDCPGVSKGAHAVWVEPHLLR